MFNSLEVSCWYVNQTGVDAIAKYGMSIHDALGLIPSFMQRCAISSIDCFKSELGDVYQGSALYEFGGEVLDSGDYRSDCDDPDLKWLACSLLPNGFRVFVYEYAIVACVAPDGLEEHNFVTRLD